ncbi:hypothetical protein [Streptomyces sp. CC224B]|uniref:hypothetical protein n=1 Tax=Streptomyces sp. CC224B TaxID=3044571 RepID=UPI0024A7BA5A|nr:hypothetical protein [Streptomyces sp. CC224B]
MTAQIIGGLLYDLGDSPVGARYSRGEDGMPIQQLVLGTREGDLRLSISLTTTSVGRIDELIETLARIRDDKIRQERIKTLPEVA